MSTSYDLLNIKADNGSLVLPQQTDYRLRQAFAAAGLDSAFEAINARIERLQQLEPSCELEIESVLAFCVVLFEHEHLEGMGDYINAFKTHTLDRRLQLSPSQISQTLGAAKVKAQAKTSATATDAEKALIADMPRRVAYEYSRLSLPERRSCLEEHVSKGKDPTKRSVMSHKRVKNVLPTQTSGERVKNNLPTPASAAITPCSTPAPEPEQATQPPLPLVDVVASPVEPQHQHQQRVEAPIEVSFSQALLILSRTYDEESSIDTLRHSIPLLKHVLRQVEDRVAEYI